MRSIIKQKDMVFLIAAVVVLNVIALSGQAGQGLIYLSDKALDGQWYRFFTAPFVHVGLYHLLIDGTAFVMLYWSLPYPSAGKRLAVLLGIHTAVMIGVSIFPRAAGLGYCGLSGIDHGLMAVWCLAMMRDSDKAVRYAGLAGFGITLLKSIYEAASGDVAFAFLHLGSVGTPVVSSHLAGVIGGVLMFFALEKDIRQRMTKPLILHRKLVLMKLR